MSVRILTGEEVGDRGTDRACMFDSVTDTAFGPVFRGGGGFTAREQAAWFLEWLDGEDGRDPREIDRAGELEEVHARWEPLDATGVPRELFQ